VEILVHAESTSDLPQVRQQFFFTFELEFIPFFISSFLFKRTQMREASLLHALITVNHLSSIWQAFSENSALIVWNVSWLTCQRSLGFRRVCVYTDRVTDTLDRVYRHNRQWLLFSTWQPPSATRYRSQLFYHSINLSWYSFLFFILLMLIA
jgi:hypothetical protein